MLQKHFADNAGGWMGDRSTPEEDWPWELALTLLEPSDHLELGSGDFPVSLARLLLVSGWHSSTVHQYESCKQVPPSWWCRLRKIVGAGSSGPSATRLILPENGFHVSGGLTLEHVVLVQTKPSAPVLWVHEDSSLRLLHSKVVGEGVRLCVATG